MLMSGAELKQSWVERTPEEALYRGEEGGGPRTESERAVVLNSTLISTHVMVTVNG